MYKRYLKNELDWVIRRDIWRDRAIEIRAEVSLRAYSRVMAVDECEAGKLLVHRPRRIHSALRVDR